jgi:hypothetical protein
MLMDFVSNTSISFSTLRNRVNKPFTRNTNVMMKGATAVLVAGDGRMHGAMAHSGADLRSDRGGIEMKVHVRWTGGLGWEVRAIIGWCFR